MSTPARDARLWARLREAGQATGEAPAHGDTPWYLALLSGVAAWVAAVFLFVFVVDGLHWYREHSGAMLALGAASAAFALLAMHRARGRVFVDVIKDGKRAGVKLSPMYAEMRLGILRGEVEAREPRKATRNPFEPDRATSEKAAAEMARTGGVDRATRIAAAEKLPAVMRLHSQGQAQGSKRTLTQVAEAWIENEDALSAAAGGVS